MIDGIGQFENDAEHVPNDRAQPTVVYAGSLRTSTEWTAGRRRLGPNRPAGHALEVYGTGTGWLGREVAAEQTQIEGPRLLSRGGPAEGLPVGRSARPAATDEPGFVRYSFPSKIIEYLASGTPVLTTRWSV